jgi:ferritin-like metal-binding protein YciE
MKTMASRSKKSEKTLCDLFAEELEDMYYVEKRLIKALPKMAKAVSSPELKKAFQAHLDETEGHADKLEQVFAAVEMKPKATTCEAIAGILEEGEEILTTFKGTRALDAAVICGAQKVEHYEIATYGCLHAWAEKLGNEEAASLLGEILAEEKACNDRLTDIAESAANEHAQSDDGVSEEENYKDVRRSRRGTVKHVAAARQSHQNARRQSRRA